MHGLIIFIIIIYQNENAVNEKKSRYCIICTLHFKGNCDFENGLCGWSNILSNDSFDWSRKQGRTSTVGTGPSGDHTTKTHAGFIFYTLLFPDYLVCLNLLFMGYNYLNKKIDWRCV